MEFFVTHQTVEHYSGDCAVAFVFKDKTHQNKDLQQLLELNRFDAIVGATLMLSQSEMVIKQRDCWLLAWVIHHSMKRTT